MPTPLLLNGFESRVFAVGGVTSNTFWDQVSGTAPATSTTHRGSGARSMLCSMPNGVSYSSSNRTPIASQTRLAIRFYFRKSANPSANVRPGQWQSSGTEFINLTLNTSGQLFLDLSGGTSIVDGSVTAALTNDQWYLVDVVIDGSTTSLTARLWLDGTVATTDGTMTTALASAFTTTRIGVITAATVSPAVDLYFDDYIVGTASGITDKFADTDGIVGLLPDADGTHSPSPPTATHFTDAAGADINNSTNPAWDNLDSGDLTQTAEHVKQPVIGATEYVEVTFGTTTLSAAAPVAVQAAAGLNTDGTNAFTASFRVVNGGATTNVVNALDWSIAAGTKTYQRGLVTVANQSELDGLKGRIGFGGAQPATPIYDGLMIEVDVGVSAGAPAVIPDLVMGRYG